MIELMRYTRNSIDEYYNNMHACMHAYLKIAHIVLLIVYYIYTQAYITRRQFPFSYRTEIFLAF